MRRHGEALNPEGERPADTRNIWRCKPQAHPDPPCHRGGAGGREQDGCLERAAEALRQKQRSCGVRRSELHMWTTRLGASTIGVLIRHANTALMMLTGSASSWRREVSTLYSSLCGRWSRWARRGATRVFGRDAELILKGGWPNRLASLAGCKDAIQKLRDAGGRDPEQEEEEEEEEEEEDGTEANDAGRDARTDARPDLRWDVPCVQTRLKRAVEADVIL